MISIFLIQESSIEEFISEEDMMRSTIRTRYLKRHNGDIENTLSVREYQNLVRAYTVENYLEALQEEGRLNRLDRIIRKNVDTNTITLAKYDNAIKSLLDAKNNDEFQSVIKKLNPNVKF